PSRQSGLKPAKLPVFWMWALLQASAAALPPPPLAITTTSPMSTASARMPAAAYPATRRMRPLDAAACSAASRCARSRSFSSLRLAIRGDEASGWRSSFAQGGLGRRLALPDLVEEPGELVVEALGRNPPFQDRVGLDQPRVRQLVGEHA